METLVLADTALQEEDKKKRLFQEEARAAEQRSQLLEKQKVVLQVS